MLGFPTSATLRGASIKVRVRKLCSSRPRRRLFTPMTKVSVGCMVAVSGAVLYDRAYSQEMAGLAPKKVLTQWRVNAEEAVTEEPQRVLPVYSISEVKSHDSKDKRVWVVYENLVYDVTDFIDYHPGGELIMLAAGDFLDPFWNTFPRQHLNPETKGILSEFLIGKLDQSSMEGDGSSRRVELNGFDSIPADRRPENYTVHTERPFNAESTTEALIEPYLTPTELFYVRNHLWTPLLSSEQLDSYKVTVAAGSKVVDFTLTELLARFPLTTITATLQCAGNRRKDMIREGQDSSSLPPIHGIPWELGAIGTATFTGVKLSDVLKAFFLLEATQGESKHVCFYGLEKYSASIPLSAALDESSDVLLAVLMNGEPLTPDHGFPLRVVVPGVTAARSVKWLSKIELTRHEADSHWQRNDYKILGPDDLWSPKFAERPSIQATPVQSAILVPKAGSLIKSSEPLSVRGYAWVGGGRQVARVDVSVDNGESWQTANWIDAEEFQNARSSEGKTWAWRKWQLSIPAERMAARFSPGSEVTIMCRAVDSENNVQPPSSLPIYNARGLLSTAIHKVPVSVT